MISTYIKVQSQYEGFHTWADAPDDIAFLRNEHRHLFKYEFVVEVKHDDRELEFFQVQRKLDAEIRYYFGSLKKWKDLGSCEMQATQIIGFFQNQYDIRDRPMQCTVSEDGENAGIVFYTPDN